MTKIILKTSVVKLPGRKREPDIDHALQIRDYVRRGYTVTARDEDSWWSLSVLRYPDHAFVNQPEETTETIRVAVHHGTENAALVDMYPPEWVTKLDRLIRTAFPPTTHVSSNLNLQGDTTHG